LHGGGFAESAGFALKGNAHGLEVQIIHVWLSSAGMLSPARHGQL
jgi:hypothetical protein